MSTKITIEAEYSSLTPRVRKRLSIIGKRAKTINGEAMFSDLTPSSNEEGALTDLFDSGAETLVANLMDLSLSYEKNSDATKLIFSFTNLRWDYTDKDGTIADVTKALSEAISNYLVDFCLAQYLAEIHPTTGAKYPPLFGQTYIDHCSVILNNIRAIAYHKRPSALPQKSIGDISGGEVVS